MKRCSSCKEVKSKSDFAKNRFFDDVLQTACKECDRIRCQRYRQTPKGKESLKKAHRKEELKYPEKEMARRKLRYAVASGKVVKPSQCEGCFTEVELGGHHEDYSKPFEVEWFCDKCHKELHRKVMV